MIGKAAGTKLFALAGGLIAGGPNAGAGYALGSTAGAVVGGVISSRFIDWAEEQIFIQMGIE